MSSIDIEREHKLGLEEVRKRLEEMEEKLRERYGVKIAWRGDEAEIKATGVSGTISIAEAKVIISIKLGMMMKPLGSKIREAMERQLEKALA